MCGAKLEEGHEAVRLYREVPCYHNDTSLEGADVDLCPCCRARLYKEMERMRGEKGKPRG